MSPEISKLEAIWEVFVRDILMFIFIRHILGAIDPGKSISREYNCYLYNYIPVGIMQITLSSASFSGSW